MLLAALHQPDAEVDVNDGDRGFIRSAIDWPTATEKRTNEMV